MMEMKVGGRMSMMEMDVCGEDSEGGRDDEHGGEWMSMIGMMKVVEIMSIVGTDEYGGHQEGDGHNKHSGDG